MLKKVIFISFILTISSNAQAWFTEIGYTALQAQEGLATPNGTGISVGMVEGSVGANYTPDTASSQFLGKTITDVTGTSGGVSSHANTVATRFFSNAGSIASEITNINAYSADDYLGNLLEIGTANQPSIFSEKIMNHSYVSSGFTTGSPLFTPLPLLTSEALKRFDFSLVRDNTLAVVGLNNGSGTAVPALLAHNYNGISVGLTSGNHSRNGTTTEVAGRVKPDLVAPDSFTSFSTPQVSSSAAVLLSSIHNTSNYENITSQKAVLMAGATKEEAAIAAVWSRTSAQSLDATYGAGEVNVHNSFNILAAGEQGPGAVDENGWDLASVTEIVDNTYSFTIDPAHLLTELSVALTWNRDVDNTNFTLATVSNLRLELTDDLGNQIQLADSLVDNVEHIYINPGIEGSALAAGTYNLIVSSSDGDSDYSLAWRSEIIAIPEPSSTMLIYLSCLGFILRRSRT